MPAPYTDPLPIITSGDTVTTEQWLELIRTVKAYLVLNGKSPSKLVEADFTVRTGIDPGIATLVRRYGDLYDIVQAIAAHNLAVLP